MTGKNTIPTAEEYLSLKVFNKTTEQIANIMIEFTKLHCQAQAKEILINVDIDMNSTNKNELPNPHFQVIKESILNAYPQSNIK